MPIVSVTDGHVGPAGLVVRRSLVSLDSHQMRMPYIRSRVVDAGGVVVTVKSERGSLLGRDGGSATDMDVLRMVVSLNKRQGVFTNH